MSGVDFANSRLCNELKLYLTTTLSYGRKINDALAKYSCSISLTEGENAIRGIL